MPTPHPRINQRPAAPIAGPVDWSRWNTEELPLLRTILSLRGQHSMDEAEARPTMVGPPPPVPPFNAHQGQTLLQQPNFSTPPPSQLRQILTDPSQRPTPSPGSSQTPRELHQPWNRRDDQQNRSRGGTQYSTVSPSQDRSPQPPPLGQLPLQLLTYNNPTSPRLNRPPQLPPKPVNQPPTPPTQTRSRQTPPPANSAPRFFREIQIHQEGKQPAPGEILQVGPRQDSTEAKHKHLQDPTAKNHRDQQDQVRTTSDDT